jgi:hypothetical protein
MSPGKPAPDPTPSDQADGMAEAIRLAAVAASAGVGRSPPGGDTSWTIPTAFLGHFVIEAERQLDLAEACIDRLGADPGHLVAADAGFRALHTLSGGAGFMHQPITQATARAAERVLDAVRDGMLAADRATLGLLRAALAQLRRQVGILATGTQPADDAIILRDRLARLLPADFEEYRPQTAPSPPPPQPQPVALPVRHDAFDAVLGRLAALEPDDRPGADVEVALLLRLAGSPPSDAGGAWTRLRAALELLGPDRGDDPHIELVSAATELVRQVRRRAAAGSEGIQPPTASRIRATPGLAAFVTSALTLLAGAETALLDRGDRPKGAADDRTAGIGHAFCTIQELAGRLGLMRIAPLARLLGSALAPGGNAPAAWDEPQERLALAGIRGLRALISQLRSSGSDSGPWPAEAAACARQLGLEPGDGRHAATPPDRHRDLCSALADCHRALAADPADATVLARMAELIRELAALPHPVPASADPLPNPTLQP